MQKRRGGEGNGEEKMGTLVQVHPELPLLTIEWPRFTPTPLNPVPFVPRNLCVSPFVINRQPPRFQCMQSTASIYERDRANLGWDELAVAVK